MTRNNLNNFLANRIGLILFIFSVLFIFPRAASATNIVLNLENAPLKIDRNRSVVKRIIGIPKNAPGKLELTMKWHAKSLIPNTFNKLTIVLLHGSGAVETLSNCYSKHADKTPRCVLFFQISQTEANRAGDWKLQITNNSDHDVDGFNIVKESSDLNPFVPNIKSFFTPDCSARNLSLAASTGLDVSKRSTAETTLFGVTSIAGEIQIRAKWHTDTLTSNIFHKLTVEVLYNGNVVASDEGYSIHSNQKDKLNIKVKVGMDQANSWKIRLKNDSESNIRRFDIKKGSDPNPFVPVFQSVYVPCT